MGINKRTLEKMYKSGLSMKEISEKLACGESTIVYYMKKFSIPRRSRSDATYVKRNPKGDPFKEKKNLNRDDLFLKGLGLGLYWGEGTKKNENSIRLGNTDPHLVKLFVFFLKKIYEIDDNKLRFGLQVFSDMSADDARLFWSKFLNVKEDRFFKVTVTKSRSIGTYREKTKHGVLTVYFNNIKIRKIFKKEIEELKKLPR